ncbi:MAG: MoaD/ThiS family protein [Flavobacteriales bacterium]|nr:MoaD/ThiS family protein [Flavobacteriales bacterium]
MNAIIIPTPLRKFTGGAGRFESPAESVQDLLSDLVKSHEGLRPHLFDNGGDLRSFIRVYVGDEDIHELEGTATRLSAGTEVSIIPAIAGGIA